MEQSDSSITSVTNACKKHLVYLDTLTISAPAEQFLNQLSMCQQGQDVKHLYQQSVLMALDDKAKQIIAKQAVDLSLLTALSPIALLDMLLVLHKQLSMINQLSRLYGIKLSYMSRIKLLRKIIKNAGIAAGTELFTDIGLDALGVELAGKLSSRVAQGLAIGMLTARLGNMTIEACRPIGLEQQKLVKLTDIKSQIVDRFKQIKK
jgi:putative membrane protein